MKTSFAFHDTVRLVLSPRGINYGGVGPWLLGLCVEQLMKQWLFYFLTKYFNIYLYKCLLINTKFWNVGS